MTRSFGPRDVYADWMAAWEALLDHGRSLPLGEGGDTGPRPRIRPSLGVAMLCMPHPDDECLTGALPWRWRQQGVRIENVSVTLGSNPARRAARRAEWSAARRVLGFDGRLLARRGLEKVTPQNRRGDPGAWECKAGLLRERIAGLRPRAIVYPHAADAHATHRGTHLLVRDALRDLPPEYEPLLVETEYWSALPRPNLMVEVTAAAAAGLLRALAMHAGEVCRNPYHLSLPAWMMDNVRRGAELLGGQGSAAPAMRFATLYRVRRRRRGRMVPPGRGFCRLLPAEADPLRILEP